MFFEEFRDVGTAALFEDLEGFDLGEVSFVGVSATQALVDVAVEVDPDLGADAVFDGFDGHEDVGNGSP